jgi:hypothetical protein
MTQAAAKRFGRICRVRRVQHLEAAVQAQNSESEAASLEDTAQRLASLRGDMGAKTGKAIGSMIGNSGELTMRLNVAHHAIAVAIAAARERAAEHVAKMLEARMRKEQAERLELREQSALSLRNDTRNMSRRPALAHANKRGE